MKFYYLFIIIIIIKKTYPSNGFRAAVISADAFPVKFKAANSPDFVLFYVYY